MNGDEGSGSKKETGRRWLPDPLRCFYGLIDLAVENEALALLSGLRRALVVSLPNSVSDANVCRVELQQEPTS